MRTRMASAIVPAQHAAEPDPPQAMRKTAYVLLSDAAERAWIDAALQRCVDRIVFLDGVEGLPVRTADDEADCLIVSAEPVEQGVVKALGKLRESGNTIAVIALGSHAAFRQAIDIARMDSTDVLERPVSDRELRQAVKRMCRLRR